MFKIGDTVVYPHHGAGRILGVIEKVFQGAPRRYYNIQIIHNDLKVMVPVDGMDRAGIRHAISGTEVEGVVGVLRDDPTRMPKDWNRRVKHNQDKIKTGDVYEVADVVRNLALRDSEKGLSTGEKQMFGKVKHILASEFMLAKDMGEADAQRFLDDILVEICARARCAGQGAVG